jgi:hypothetical protein
VTWINKLGDEFGFGLEAEFGFYFSNFKTNDMMP